MTLDYERAGSEDRLDEVCGSSIMSVCEVLASTY